MKVIILLSSLLLVSGVVEPMDSTRIPVLESDLINSINYARAEYNTSLIEHASAQEEFERARLAYAWQTKSSIDPTINDDQLLAYYAQCLDESQRRLLAHEQGVSRVLQLLDSHIQSLVWQLYGSSFMMRWQDLNQAPQLLKVDSFYQYGTDTLTNDYQLYPSLHPQLKKQPLTTTAEIPSNPVSVSYELRKLPKKTVRYATAIQQGMIR